MPSRVVRDAQLQFWVMKGTDLSEQGAVLGEIWQHFVAEFRFRSRTVASKHCIIATGRKTMNLFQALL
jgi:hypothetical protein